VTKFQTLGLEDLLESIDDAPSDEDFCQECEVPEWLHDLVEGQDHDFIPSKEN
jgi:hypothetical protein